MKLPRTQSNPITPKSQQWTTERMSAVLNGNVSYGHSTSNSDEDINMDCWKATGTTPGTANTAFIVNHNLTRVPIGFHTIRVNVAGATLYDSGTAWTAATNVAQGTISLKCNQASVAFTIIII